MTASAGWAFKPTIILSCPPLQRSLGYFDDPQGQRHFLAHDRGILRVAADKRIFLMARVILRGTSLPELEQELEQRVRRLESGSQLMRENLHNLQKTLMKQMLALDPQLLGGWQ